MRDVLKTGKGENIPDLSEDDRFDKDTDKYTGTRYGILLLYFEMSFILNNYVFCWVVFRVF